MKKEKEVIRESNGKIEVINRRKDWKITKVLFLYRRYQYTFTLYNLLDIYLRMS